MITCVIASYKYGHLVSQAIESVLSQTKKFDKIIVVDDGAYDLNLALTKYVNEDIKWVMRSDNLGTVLNFQDILMNHVDTEQCMFLGADNYLRPDTLEILTKYEADIISYDIALFGTESPQFARRVGAYEVKNGFPIWRFKHGNINICNYIHGSSLYNVSLAKEVGGYHASGNRNSEEDWMLWRAMLAKKATHIHVPEPLLYYRRHKHNFIKPRQVNQSNHEPEMTSDVELKKENSHA